MTDLNNSKDDFDWDSLYQKYDSQCKGFNKDKLEILSGFIAHSDRDLYYKIIDEIKKDKTLTPETYFAIVYWKLNNLQGDGFFRKLKY